jgi:predicted oxidoreductase
MAQWGMNAQQRLAWIQTCLDLGITSFDHADIYGDFAVQALFGEALALEPQLRSRMQLISKAGICPVSGQAPSRRTKHYDSSAQHLVASCEQSLRDLRTDHLDLLLIHRPDPLSDWQEIAQAFERLRSQGKVRAFGVSNFSTAQFEALHALTPLVTNQIEFSVLQTRALHDDTLLQAQRLACPPMAWSPLGGGRLFAAAETQDEPARRVRSCLEAMAQEMQTTAATLAYAWIMRHPSQPMVITGSQRVEAMREALAASALQLDREQWTRVWESSMGHRVP